MTLSNNPGNETAQHPSEPSTTTPPFKCRKPNPEDMDAAASLSLLSLFDILPQSTSLVTLLPVGQSAF